MQPSLQTTPATDTPPPCTSQESASNDYDACQDQETSKVGIGEIFYNAKMPKGIFFCNEDSNHVSKVSPLDNS